MPSPTSPCAHRSLRGRGVEGEGKSVPVACNRQLAWARAPGWPIASSLAAPRDPDRSIDLRADYRDPDADRNQYTVASR